MMPKMEGFEVLHRLKDGARLRRIPAIMISALDDLDSVGALHRPRRRGPPAQVVSPVLLKARIGACLENKRWHDQEVAYLERIEREKAKHEALLRNILPGDIVTRLNGGEVVIADRVEEATILFADLVGFSAIAAQVRPTALVDDLKRIFSTSMLSANASESRESRPSATPTWTSRMLRHSSEFLARDLIKGIGQIRTAFLIGTSGSARTGPLAGVLDEA
jgi:response regulator RpfG family c-di-GMP phosphodiesterase